MLRFFLRRLLISLALVLIVVTLVFFLLRLIPGDPAQVALGDNASAEQLQLARQRMGLEDNVFVQYVNWLGRFARFDLGVSLIDGHSIAGDVGKRLPRTLELAFVSVVLAILIGLPAGVYAAFRRNKLGDAGVSTYALLGLSIPNFVLGSVGALLFGVIWKILPSGGFTDVVDDPSKHFTNMVMPATVLAIGLSANLIRLTRAAMLDVLSQDYVRTARSKGLASVTVLRRHVVRNGLVPVVAAFGIQIGNLIGGTVIVEYIFNWPGISSLLINSISLRDYTAVQAVIVIIALLFLTINLVVEILYAYINPRIRYS